jgi:hypothetical protein
LGWGRGEAKPNQINKEGNMGYGAGMGMGFFGGLISLALLVWFVIFTVLVLNKLDKLIDLMSKK